MFSEVYLFGEKRSCGERITFLTKKLIISWDFIDGIKVAKWKEVTEKAYIYKQRKILKKRKRNLEIIKSLKLTEMATNSFKRKWNIINVQLETMILGVLAMMASPWEDCAAQSSGAQTLKRWSWNRAWTKAMFLLS